MNDPSVGQRLATAWLDVVAGGDDAAVRWLRRDRSGAGHHVDALRLEPGTARLRVPGTRGRPPEVALRVPLLAGDEWDEVIEIAGRNLRSTADLLAGRLPDDLAAPRLLVPDRVDASCSADAAERCRHKAVAHNVMAAAITRDPFRLLQLRGHRRQDVLAALREARGVRSGIPTEQVDLSDPHAARAPLALDVHPHPPTDVTLLLDRLGPPPGIDDPAPVEAGIAAAADMAWRLAAGEGGAVADDQVLISELRAQQVTTAERLADALGLEPAAVAAHLDRLYHDGAVLRMGTGDRARYRAA